MTRVYYLFENPRKAKSVKMDGQHWRRTKWWVEQWEEHLDLTQNQLVIKGKLPSYLATKQLKDKARLLDKISNLVSNLPLIIFFRLLLYLNIECTLFLQAMGLDSSLKASISNYPARLHKAWLHKPLPFSYKRVPKMDLSGVTPSALLKVDSFATLFSASTVSDIESNPLYTKLQVDAVHCSFSAFNPLYPIIGMCLNNNFSYHILQIDSNVYQSTPNAFCNNSHIKYIFDFPCSKVEAAKWSPSGELLAILTKPPQNLAPCSWIYSINVVLAYYSPSTGIVREYKFCERDSIQTNSFMATPNVWCSNSGLLLTDRDCKKFVRYVVDTNFSEIKTTTLGTTTTLDSYVRGLDAVKPEILGRTPSKIGCMSVCENYPPDVASFIIFCGNHPGLYHHSILFFNVSSNILLQKIDLSGFIRSLSINSLHTYYLLHDNQTCGFFRKPLELFTRCNLDPWMGKRKVPTCEAKGKVVGVTHSGFELEELQCPNHSSLNTCTDEKYSNANEAKTPEEFRKVLLQTAFDRCMQANDTSIIVSYPPTAYRNNVSKICLLTGTVKPVPTDDWKPTNRKMHIITTSKNGLLSCTEYNGIWSKPKIHHSHFLASKDAPQAFNCFSKLYYEKPLKLKRLGCNS